MKYRVAMAAVVMAGLMAAGVAWGELTPEQLKEVRMLEHLGNLGGFANRQAFVKRLIEMGPEVLPAVEKARTGARNAGTKLGCEMIMRGIARVQAGKGEEGEGELKEKLPKDISLELRMLMEMLWVGDAAVRGQAAKELGESADPAAVELLMGRLDDPDETVRQGAASGLRSLSGEMFAADAESWQQWWEEIRHPKEKVEDLMARLSDPRQEERSRAIWKLGYVKDARAVDVLVERFVGRTGGESRGKPVYPEDSNDPNYRKDYPHLRAALMAQGDRATWRMIPVAGFGWGIQKDALEMIGRTGKEAVPMLIAALKGKPETDEAEVERLARELMSVDAAARDEAVRKLIDVGDAARPTMYRVAKEMRSREMGLRCLMVDRGISERQEGAAKGLGLLKPIEGVKPLVSGVRADSSGLTNEAFEALMKYGKEAGPALKEAMGDERLSETSRVAAAVLLVHWGDKSGWGLLEVAVEQGDSFLMNRTVSRMGMLGDREFLVLVAKALERYDAEQGLAQAAGRCGGKDAIPILEKALGHPKEAVRLGAKWELERLGATAKPDEKKGAGK